MRINGYYNFGDSTNNYVKEDETSEEFIKINTELQGLKIVCFTNLIVCKFKMQEFQSVIAITDQILDMDENNEKALFFRGRSHVAVQEFKQGVEYLSKLVKIVPDNKDFQRELANAKKKWAADQASQQKVFSKMFN